MKFGFLLAVKDIKLARAFYEELFGLTVAEDFGRNISFDCGLSLQQDFDWLAGIPKEEMKEKENNCEVYFEREPFDEFVQKLKSRSDITLLHDVFEHDWGQRVIRFYDPDSHLIEVGEPITAVVERFMARGMSLAEIAAQMEVSVSDVQKMLQA